MGCGLSPAQIEYVIHTPPKAIGISFRIRTVMARSSMTSLLKFSGSTAMLPRRQVKISMRLPSAAATFGEAPAATSAHAAKINLFIVSPFKCHGSVDSCCRLWKVLCLGATKAGVPISCALPKRLHVLLMFQPVGRVYWEKRTSFFAFRRLFDVRIMRIAKPFSVSYQKTALAR